MTVVSDKAVVPLGTRFYFNWQDGTEMTELLDPPLGEAFNPFSFIQDKFLSLAKPVYGDKAGEILHVAKDLENYRAKE